MQLSYHMNKKYLSEHILSFQIKYISQFHIVNR